MNDFQKGIRRGQAIIEAHSSQLRAKVLALLEQLGFDWVERFQEKVIDLQDSEKPTERVTAMLAEIGFCAVLSNVEPFTDD